MEYRKLGNTDMVISQLSFGASSLGGVFHDIDEKEAIRTVHVAVERGMNFIDVSPYYGFTKAETVLGKALIDIPREKYYLSTKTGRFGADGVKSWDYSAERALKSIDESLKRLNIDYVDLLNVHDIEFSDLNQVINETIPAIQKIIKSGKARYIGVTGLPLEKIKYVVEHVPDGTLNSILSFCHYTLNDPSLVNYVGLFESKGIGVINASPLGMGLLTERGTPGWHPAADELKLACKKAADYCKSKNYRIEQLAVKFSVSNPRIATTLISSANPANISDSIRWAEAPLNNELQNEVVEMLKPFSLITWENS